MEKGSTVSVTVGLYNFPGPALDILYDLILLLLYILP